MNITVQRPGALTTIQDAGRFGYRHLGVGRAGALDGFSAHTANLLLDNAADAAVLEITLAGPTLLFAEATRIAITGADIDARADAVDLPGWRTVHLAAGSRLELSSCRRGARAYLGVRGGFTLAPVLGSRSTDLRAGFGGCQGRALRNGDVLEAPASSEPGPDTTRVAPWWIDPTPTLDLRHDARVRVLPGRDRTAPADALFSRSWRIANASDRQGLRLDGEPLALAHARECISEPVAPGCIQLPPDGQPIVLMADAQTVGGYPCIGYVIAADLPRLAQCRPGDSLHFEPIGERAAHTRLRAQQQSLARMELALAQRRRLDR